ncbi:MAG: sensor histidine kinase [Crocinitomicaceae bacterium]
MRSTLNSQRFYWLIQFLGWGAYVLITFGLSYIGGTAILTQKLLLYYLFSVLFSVLGAHSLRFIILKYNWLNMSTWRLIFFSIFSALIIAFLFESIQGLYHLYIVKPDFYTREVDYFGINFTFGVFFSFIIFSLWFGIYYAYLFIEKSRNQEIKNLQFEASRNEIELKNLRAQINPHFLFNSLNSIKALVEINKEESKIAITKLSNLLRNSIQLGKNRLIPIEKELELVKTYLDIEKIRFEDHIQVEYRIDQDLIHYKIPPLMIQTIAENAIKHGLSKLEKGGKLIIELKEDGNNININVSNSGTISKVDANRGVGIENTRKRLSIIFGEASYFNLFETQGMVHAHIEIQKISEENED